MMDREQISTQTEDRLFAEARAAAALAYAPYSKFRVGAALLTSRGEIVSGCNVENASYGLTNCAERTAIFRAVAENKLNTETEIAAIVVVNPQGKACTPCGACRQVIYQFGRSALVLYEKSGERKRVTIAELLPDSFLL